MPLQGFEPGSPWSTKIGLGVISSATSGNIFLRITRSKNWGCNSPSTKKSSRPSSNLKECTGLIIWDFQLWGMAVHRGKEGSTGRFPPYCGDLNKTSLVFKMLKVVQKLNGPLFEWWPAHQTILVCYSNGDHNTGLICLLFRCQVVKGTGHLYKGPF